MTNFYEYSMNDMLAELRKNVQEELHVNIDVVLGGSESIAEQSAYSDRDIYVIAKNIFGLLKLLRGKKKLQDIKSSLHIVDTILLASRGMLRMRLLYVHGIDQDKHLVSTNVNFKNIAATSVKIAYRDLARAMQETDIYKKQYYLGRAALHATLVESVYEGNTWQQPYFGITEVSALTSDEHMKRLIAGKQVQDGQIDENDVGYVATALDRVYDVYKNKPIPLRAWFLRTLIVCKSGQWHKLRRNYDKKVLVRLKKMIDTENFEEFPEVCKDIVYIWCI